MVTRSPLRILQHTPPGSSGNPANLEPTDPDDPYADYTVTQLYDFLGTYELTTDPGSHFEYSNVGVALLGHALALHAGMPFEDLVRNESWSRWT